MLEVPSNSNSLVYTFSRKSDENLSSTTIWLNLQFKNKIFKYQLQIHIQHFQIGFNTFKIETVSFFLSVTDLNF